MGQESDLINRQYHRSDGPCNNYLDSTGYVQQWQHFLKKPQSTAIGTEIPQGCCVMQTLV